MATGRQGLLEADRVHRVQERRHREPLHPDGATKLCDIHQATIRAAQKKLDPPEEFPGIRLHDLRHTHATHLLQARIHPKVVRERLGHASISTTIDIYSHVLSGMQESAAILDAE